MRTSPVAIIGAVLLVGLPLLCSSAEPVVPDMPDRSAQTMSSQMGMNDATAIGNVVLDQLELDGGPGRAALAWDGAAWYGTDYNKLWFKTEGSPNPSNHDGSRNELLFDRALTRWWDLQAGVRYDIGNGPARVWAAVGAEGLAPYWRDVQVTLYFGGAGSTAARLQVEHDMLITQRLVVQPEIEANLYSQSDVARQLRSGLSDAQVGLRVRYEVRREFSPYLGLAWRHNLDTTASSLFGSQSRINSLVWVAGFHVWL